MQINYKNKNEVHNKFTSANMAPKAASIAERIFNNSSNKKEKNLKTI